MTDKRVVEQSYVPYLSNKMAGVQLASCSNIH